MTTEKKPYQTVYAVTDIHEGNRKDSRWVRIGVMFPNKDGGHSIVLEALPLDWNRTKLITQPAKAREGAADET